jgi:anhydro-N-acetylmuramic acid kinase
VTGGGRHNAYFMQRFAEELRVPVDPVEAAGWDGDFLEAQCFAYLAVRSLLGLPLSLPTTTGVPQPLTGGEIARPPERG